MQGPRWIGHLIYLAGLAARGAAVYGYMITVETVNLMPDNLPIRVVALYHFVHFPDPQAVRDPLYDFCDTHDIKGTILLAHEGINGTVAGTPESISALARLSLRHRWMRGHGNQIFSRAGYAFSPVEGENQA